MNFVGYGLCKNGKPSGLQCIGDLDYVVGRARQLTKENAHSVDAPTYTVVPCYHGDPISILAKPSQPKEIA